ncbi:MAG: hypothetical protein NT089_02810, partial [Planctomycetia bacterium]|nr:hypothetical protein [Planctomycetia bacterium]
MAPSRASFVLLRDELLEREAFDTLLEAKVLIERWRQHYSIDSPGVVQAQKSGIVGGKCVHP